MNLETSPLDHHVHVHDLPAGWEVQRTPVHGETEPCWNAMRMEDAVEIWVYDDGQVEMDSVSAVVHIDEVLAVLLHLRSLRAGK
jgi:hypothetical protein